MKDSSQDKSSSWKSWLIKKLLSNDSSKEEILNFIATEKNTKNTFENFDDNNEKNLIKNILELGKKSVDDVMVPRGEIISVNKNTNPLYVKGRISEKTDVGLVIGRRGKQNRAHAKLCDETGIIEITLW